MSYSQNDEEEVILDYFEKHPLGYLGCFLDIGANDGVTLSNTWALTLQGWVGVLIEPSYRAFNRMRVNYMNERCGDNPHGPHYFHNIAITSFNGIGVFNESGELLGKGDVALVSTLKQEDKDRFKNTVEYKEIEVKCETWEYFILHSKFKTFDFISMDIEGCEMEVLPFMDISTTKLICIEWNGNNDVKEQYEEYLEGFNLIHTTGENLIYGRE